MCRGLQPGTSVLLQGLLDSGEEDGFINRFRQEVDCTALHRFDARGDITAWMMQEQRFAPRLLSSYSPLKAPSGKEASHSLRWRR